MRSLWMCLLFLAAWSAWSGCVNVKANVPDRIELRSSGDDGSTVQEQDEDWEDEDEDDEFDD